MGCLFVLPSLPTAATVSSAALSVWFERPAYQVGEGDGVLEVAVVTKTPFEFSFWALITAVDETATGEIFVVMTTGVKMDRRFLQLYILLSPSPPPLAPLPLSLPSSVSLSLSLPSPPLPFPLPLPPPQPLLTMMALVSCPQFKTFYLAPHGITSV